MIDARAADGRHVGNAVQGHNGWVVRVEPTEPRAHPQLRLVGTEVEARALLVAAGATDIKEQA